MMMKDFLLKKSPEVCGAAANSVVMTSATTLIASSGGYRRC
jgi:hypothetical protein